MKLDPADDRWLQQPQISRADFQALCQMDPVFFAREVLGVSLWSRQREIIRSVRDNPRTAVKSCHGSGKSFVSAVTLAWFLWCHPNSIVATTAPTYRQVEKVLWAEVRQLYRAARRRGFPLPGRLLGAEVKLDDKWFAFGFSTDDPDRFQGLHADYILVILDEASGIHPDLWGGIEGVLAGGHARLLSIGNPTDPTSQFAREYASLPAGAKFTISAFDTPNLKAGRSIYRGLIQPDWVEDKRRRWGERSPLWQARVLGDFPDQGTDTLFPLAWIERAQRRWADAERGEKGLGCDIARFGDDETVFVERDGERAHVLFCGSGLDTMDTAGRIMAEARRLDVVPQVDVIGIGAGVVDRIREAGMDCAAMNASERAADAEKFVNARAEWFWTLRERFEEGRIAIDPDDTELANELSQIKYKFSAGRIQVEGKDEMKKRGLASPNRADALMLAFARRAPGLAAPVVLPVPIVMPAIV